MLIKNSKTDIPNIILGQDYDSKYDNATIHYDQLEKLSHFFGHNMPPHRHAQYLQIHFIHNGMVDFHIDDNVYHMQAPCCFLTPPSSPHSFQIDNNACGHVLTIHQSLLTQLLSDGLQQQSSSKAVLAIGISEQNLSDNESDQWQLIKQTFNNIALEWKTNKLAKQLTLESLVRLLIIQLMRLSPAKTDKCDSRDKVSQRDMKIFNQFADLIDQHYYQHWLLPSYIEKIAISESRLNIICQRIARHSPKKLIHHRLMLEIKRLLAFTSLSINDICYQTGFSDPAYFARFFKKQSGKTALTYRKEQTSNKYI